MLKHTDEKRESDTRMENLIRELKDNRVSGNKTGPTFQEGPAQVAMSTT